MTDQEKLALLTAKLGVTLDISRIKYDEQSHLIELNLDKLKLTQLPPEIGQFSYLELLSLNDNQFSALVSLSFNIGSGAFNRSTLLRKLNLGKYDEVPYEMARWNKGGGKILPGLVKRRELEIALWNL